MGYRPAELVVGAVQLGVAYGAANRTGKPTRDAALRLVRRAADHGVAQFDTSRDYGDSEERLGEALDGRRTVRVLTKLDTLKHLSPDAPSGVVCEAVDDSIAKSCAALRRPQLDCLMLHRAHLRHAFGGAVWDRLREHLRQGTVKALGVSVQSPREALGALGDPDIRHIQLPFNILDWRWREAGVIAARAKRPDVAIHARSIFLQGILAANDPALWPVISGVAPSSVVTWLAKTAAHYGRESAADLCLAYARGQDWIDGVVVGMETESQVDANIRLYALPPLDRAECTAIEGGAPRMPNALLDPAQWPQKTEAAPS